MESADENGWDGAGEAIAILRALAEMLLRAQREDRWNPHDQEKAVELAGQLLGIAGEISAAAPDEGGRVARQFAVINELFYRWERQDDAGWAIDRLRHRLIDLPFPGPFGTHFPALIDELLFLVDRLLDRASSFRREYQSAASAPFPPASAAEGPPEADRTASSPDRVASPPDDLSAPPPPSSASPRKSRAAASGSEAALPTSAGRPAPEIPEPEPPPPAKPKVADTEYTVWYGTNRRPIDPADPSRGYSGRRDRMVHYGTCRVFIPDSHKIGSIGSGWWKRLISRKDDRLKLRSIDELATSQFWEQLSARIRKSRKRTGIVFIHGYNVSFEEAALRAAQIGSDLGLNGAMAFFSWPSRGSLAAYIRDGQSIEASEDAIATFLIDFAERSGAERIHVIAHSMGNRGVLGAVNKIGQAVQDRTAGRFGQFILA
ncbi:MAG TPA: alpha/beta hydrolase, partial [Allosphingosinicella sp.]